MDTRDNARHADADPGPVSPPADRPLDPGDGPSYPWRFEMPLDRRALRLRAAFAVLAALLLVVLASAATRRGSATGTFLGLAGATLFAVLAHGSWRVARMAGPPLLLDERGIAFDSGRAPRVVLGWEEIADVTLRGAFFGRRVILVLREPPERELRLPASCCGDGPPEWTAGLIETFRQHALHRPVPHR